MLKEILADLLKIDDILFVIKGGGAVSEIRSNSLGIRQKEQWITIGENDGPCHMHINSESIKKAKFITEEKPERTSFSVRFFDNKDERVLGAFFTKMYDENKNIKPDRKKLYDEMLSKYGSIIEF
ncbi:MAG: Heme utilization protein ChuX/HutX [Nitrosopumilales archaeon]|nr:MAG: Heme utilization protein ChuX/HutX [Nitrosopumilales archaeon]